MLNKCFHLNKKRILTGYLPLFVTQMIFTIVFLERPEIFIYAQLVLLPFSIIFGYFLEILFRNLSLEIKKRNTLNFAIKVTGSYLLLMLIIIFSLLAITLPFHVAFMYLAWGYNIDILYLSQVYMECIVNIILLNPKIHIVSFTLPWAIWYALSYFSIKNTEVLI